MASKWTTTSGQFGGPSERIGFLGQGGDRNLGEVTIWSVGLSSWEIWLLAHGVPAWMIRPLRRVR